MKFRFVLITICSVLLAACGKTEHTKTAEPVVSAAFSADSAYLFINEQVSMGARVPGTPEHEQCARYLRDQLIRFGAKVDIQQGALTNYAGEQQQIVNIVGQYNPQANNRVLLCAHWDCRPWSDQEDTYERRMIPVLGANDAASGVGVLLEIARQLNILEKAGTAIPGVDIVFFDVEDMGTPSFYTGKERQDTWCLGSQLWAKRYAESNQKNCQYGVLLDMVAAPDATFNKEYFSMHHAASYVNKMWKTAAALGFGNYFINEQTYPLTDDHYYVNTIAGIPCLDIIHYDTRYGTGFPEYWHTNHDNMQNVSPVTLNAVGKTVLTTILNH